VIVSTQTYTTEEIQQILAIRAQEEEVDLTADALALLTKIGGESGLRYASNIITTSTLLSQKRRSNTVGVEDVMRSYELFLDPARSVKFVGQYEKRFIGDEGEVTFSYGNEDAMEIS
jgi:RuvB-like protein 2